MSEVPDEQIADAFIVLAFPDGASDAQPMVWIEGVDPYTAAEAARLGRDALRERELQEAPAGHAIDADYCRTVCVVPVGRKFWFRMDAPELAELQCCGGLEDGSHAATCPEYGEARRDEG